MLEVGSLVDGKYRILQKIGQGGMSIVYLARNERANKQWAIKEVRKDGVHDYEVVKQGLVAEIDMLKRLSHPTLPSIIDVIDGEDSFLIVMDYIEGNPLDKAIKATGAQSEDNVIEWAKQLCDVLGYLHSRTPPIIYRDMKPANVMLRPDGSVILIDFGTAREYKSGNVGDTTCLGTRGYAAPEQFGGHGQTDARTDIYCLGATMYHLVTGHNPCDYPYEMYPIRQWNPMLSTALERIILKCTQKNPNDRYQTCAELLYDLENMEIIVDDAVRKRNFRWRMFLVSCIMTVIMSACAITAYAVKDQVSKSTYSAFMDKAAISDDLDDKFENYKNAINLSPEKQEAYIDLLDVLTDDTQSDPYFTDEEYNSFRVDVLEHSNTDHSNKTNISILESENPEGYAELALKLGYACYFECEDINTSNASSRAKIWYDNALRSEKLSEQDQARAKMISSLVQNRDDVTRKKKDGTAVVDYDVYWANIVGILNNSQTDSSLMRLQMHRFALNEVIVHSGDFIRKGVKSEDIEKNVINSASELTQEVLASDEISDEMVEILYVEIAKGSDEEASLIIKAQNSLEEAVRNDEKRKENLKGSDKSEQEEQQ